MYARHFDLSKDPFSIAPDPRFLFMSERHREALAHLLFGLNASGGFVLFTGNIGTGKTTVCRCVLEQIPSGCNVAIVFNPKLSVMELLQTICQEFHVPTPATDGAGNGQSLKSLVDALNVSLLQSHAAGRSNVLIIDEAQNLQPEVLEQLRLLTNLETHERKLLQIVLIGQPELRDMLERPELEQLAQRVIGRYHLETLDMRDCKRYIQHRLTVAGHNGPLPFDVPALRRIFVLSRGVPRRINLLCGRALLGAWANGVHSVNRQMIDQAGREVFGTNQPRRKVSVWPYTGQLLGGIGVLCLLLALGLQLSPRVTHKPALELPQAGASMPQLQRQASAPEPAASQPATFASAPAPEAVPAPAPAPLPLEDLDVALPQLPHSLDVALRELARLWQHDLAEQDPPCMASALGTLQCYHGVELTMPLLRQLDRPVVLVLQQGSEPAVYAVLSGLQAQSATLRWGGMAHRVSLNALTRLWRGEFVTYWQAPEGYNSDAREGLSAALLGQLSQQLAQLEGKPVTAGAVAPKTLTTTLLKRVKAFQKGQGLTPDGHPGPLTLMQIDKALGSDGPGLQATER
jgi:general secretion pathway protein A